MNSKKSKVIKTVAAAAAGVIVVSALCSCAPLYGKIGEMMEAAVRELPWPMEAQRAACGMAKKMI